MIETEPDLKPCPVCGEACRIGPDLAVISWHQVKIRCSSLDCWYHSESWCDCIGDGFIRRERICRHNAFHRLSEFAAGEWVEIAVEGNPPIVEGGISWYMVWLDGMWWKGMWRGGAWFVTDKCYMRDGVHLPVHPTHYSLVARPLLS